MFLMSESIPVICVNDRNFKQQVIESTLPVIVVFKKSWWGTAQIMKPILEKIAKDYAGIIKVFKYNLDENSIISAYYRIDNSTTVLFFNKGDVMYKTGIISKDEFKKIIGSLLNEPLKSKQNI